MAAEYVTRWLQERKPSGRIAYLGRNEDDIHIWDVTVPGHEHALRLGIPDVVASDDALLAERLMELDTQGWVDQAGEEDSWVLLSNVEVGRGRSLFGTIGDELVAGEGLEMGDEIQEA